MRTLVGLLVSACAPAIVQDAPRVDLDAVKRRAAEQPMTFADVSPVALVARPSDFDGMKIRVIGFAVFEFERHALFPWESERRMLNAANGIWIEAPTKYVLGGFPLEAFDGKHIVVEGVFVASSRGHLNRFAGTIRSVSRLDVWDPLSECDWLRNRRREATHRGDEEVISQLDRLLSDNGCIEQLTCNEITQRLAVLSYELKDGPVGDHMRATRAYLVDEQQRLGCRE